VRSLSEESARPIYPRRNHKAFPSAFRRLWAIFFYIFPSLSLRLPLITMPGEHNLPTQHYNNLCVVTVELLNYESARAGRK
jgi:hypothetical protein